MPTTPPQADPPKRKRRWFQFSLRTFLICVLALAFSRGWFYADERASGAEPIPAESNRPAQAAASPNTDDLSPAKLTVVLDDQKYAGLLRDDLERDMVRYYVFFEDVPRERRKESWTRKGSYRRLMDILLSNDIKALIDDPRLAPFRDRRNAVMGAAGAYVSGVPHITNDLMRDDGIFERPLRLREVAGTKQPTFLASLSSRPSPPRELSSLQLIGELLKPSGPLPGPPHDFLFGVGAAAHEPPHPVALPSRLQGLDGMAVGLFDEDGNVVVVCQDGSIVRIAKGGTGDDLELTADRTAWLDVRALAGGAAGPDCSATLVSVESEKSASYQVVLEIADHGKPPRLVARSISSADLEKFSTPPPREQTGSLPRLIWAGCTRTRENRLWAFNADTNELLAFSAEAQVEFRAALLGPADYDCLRGASIVGELESLLLANLFGNEVQIRDGVPLSQSHPHSVIGEVSVEDRGKDIFRRLVRVIEWRGETWVLYPEFRRGNLVLRKIGSNRFGERFPVPNRGRVIDFELLATAAGPLLAARESDAGPNKLACRTYAFHGYAWHTTDDWHAATDQNFVYALVSDGGKPAVYSATTTMPPQFARHLIPSLPAP